MHMQANMHYVNIISVASQPYRVSAYERYEYLPEGFPLLSAS